MKNNNIKEWYLENFQHFTKANIDELSELRTNAAKMFEVSEFPTKRMRSGSTQIFRLS